MGSAMLGITAVGTYIPYYRLSRKAIEEAWHLEQAESLLIGERSVAGYDEDSVTMAVEATLDATDARETNAIDVLFFASTTSPFGEKSSAALVAAATDITAHRTVDVAGSLRAGTSALALAFDAVRAGSAREAAVAAADLRRPEPGTLLEAVSGDGAATIILGRDDDVIAELVGEVHLSAPTIDVWRRSDDRYLQTDDEAYANHVGYRTYINEAVTALLKKTETEPAAVTNAAIYAPDGRTYQKMAQRSPLGARLAELGMQGAVPRLLMQAGNLGAAFAPAQLALILETAAPGDLIVLAGYGDGADAYLFRVTEAIMDHRASRSVQAWLDAKGELPSYTLAQFFRENLQGKPLFPPDVEPWTSLPLLHREQAELLRFHAQRCGTCDAVWWPHRTTCYECGAQKGFTEIPLSRRGVVKTFVAEWAVPSPLPPLGILTVDTPERARITTQSTDGDPREFSLDEEVEFVLRIFHTAKKLPHYSWKVRKIRGRGTYNES